MFGNALGESLAYGSVSPSSDGAAFMNGPDESEAETARLGRSGNPYAVWPDQTGAESARLNWYEGNARAMENFNATATRVWAAEDAQAAVNAKAALARQHARADAYGRELRKAEYRQAKLDVLDESIRMANRAVAHASTVRPWNMWDASAASRAQEQAAASLRIGAPEWLGTATRQALHANGYQTIEASTRPRYEPTMSVGEMAIRNSFGHAQAQSLANAYVAIGATLGSVPATGFSLAYNLREGNYGDAAIDAGLLAATFVPGGAAVRALQSERAVLLGQLKAEMQIGLRADLALSSSLAPEVRSASLQGSQSAAGIHPDFWASVNGEITPQSVMRALRQNGSVEGAAVAKLIKRGAIELRFSDEILATPLGGEYEFGATHVTIFRNYAGSSQDAAGLTVHEVEHFLQGMTGRQYSNPATAIESEMAAYSAQRNFHDYGPGKNFWLRTDEEVLKFLVDSPLYPQITQTAADQFLKAGGQYTKKLR